MRWTATLAVAAVVVGLVSGQTCPTGYVSLEGECLAFLSSYGTWYNQLATCELITDSSLAKVTGDLYNAVYQYIKASEALQDKCFWIGGTDASVEGHWEWVADGTEIPLGTPYWDPCEVEPDGGYDENHLSICPDMYYFKDYPASYEHHAICQIFST